MPAPAFQKNKTKDRDIIEPTDAFLTFGTKRGREKNLTAALPAEETDVQKTTNTKTKKK